MSFLPLSSAPPSRQSPNPPVLLPSPLPPDPSSSTYNNSQQASSTAIPPPPNFRPLFTLLSTAGTSTTHHPTIHYVFSDDAPDSDPITAAALHVLNPASSTASSSPTASPRDRHGRDVKERYVLLDMDSAGTKIESAQSMSAEWAVTSTELGAAPTWDRDGEGKGEGGLMLRIEGVEVRREEGEGIEGGKRSEERSLEELVEVYERQMVELRRVVDSGQGIAMGGEGGR